jgi:hypothetical protein
MGIAAGGEAATAVVDVSELDMWIDVVEPVDQGMLPIGLDGRITGSPSEAASGRMTAIGATSAFSLRPLSGALLSFVGPVDRRASARRTRPSGRL